VKGIEDGLIFLEGGLGLVSVLPGEVYVAVEEYNEVGLLLLLFVNGCHFSWWEVMVSLSNSDFICGGQRCGDIGRHLFCYDVGGAVGGLE